MVVIKWLENVEGSGDNIYSPLSGGLYKEQDYSLVPWSGIDPDDTGLVARNHGNLKKTSLLALV